MTSPRIGTAHHAYSLSRRPCLIVAVGMAACMVLAACGGGTSATATTAPVSPTTSATLVPVATATSGGQPGASPTTAPAASVRAAATLTVPTVAATAVASVTKSPGSPTASAASAVGTVDPCVLVSKADYQAVMGDAANDPAKNAMPLREVPGFIQSTCPYKIAAGGKVQFVTVRVIQRGGGVPVSTQPGAPTTIKEYWEFRKKGWAATQATATPLTEIGTEVFLVTTPLLAQAGAGSAVHFFKGDVVFEVQAVTGSGTVDEQNAASAAAGQKLATIAFGRL